MTQPTAPGFLEAPPRLGRVPPSSIQAPRVASTATLRRRASARAELSEKILRAADELFRQRGYRHVSIDDIVAAAGVTKPTLYRHYASKDALALACLDRVAAEELHALWRAGRQADDPLSRLRAVLSAALDQLARPEAMGWRHTAALIEVRTDDHPLVHAAAAHKRRAYRWLRRLVATTPCLESEALADGLFLVVAGAEICARTMKRPDATSALAACETLIACHRP